jgi:hypothetical protein
MSHALPSRKGRSPVCFLYPFYHEQVAEVITAMTAGSPVFSAAGKIPSPDDPRDSFVSFSSIHHLLAPKSLGYADKYSKFVINYVVEWDRVITTRVEKGLKNAEALRRDYDHYQKKAETLRASATAVMSKGKSVDPKSQEKLARNEEKLVAAKTAYDKFATEMCIYLEEVTERSWRDLHPCLVKMAQFEMTISKEEATSLGQMTQVVNALKTIGDQNKVEGSGRLKELETQQPIVLSTAEKPAPLAITGGEFFGSGGSMGLGGDPWAQQQHLPPGSVAPGGLGGFPVAVASGPTSISRVTSNQSFQSSIGGSSHFSNGPNASEMLSIAGSSAPPPTMDDLNFAALTVSNTPTNTYGYGGNAFGDDSSATSSLMTMPMAPPPMGAPPPLPPAGYSSPMDNPYGAPAPMSYGAPAPMSYGAPAPMSYGAPTNYGAPSPAYGAPAYGMPAPTYGAPAYGAPMSFGAPAPTYGAPAYGNPPVGGPPPTF